MCLAPKSCSTRCFVRARASGWWDRSLERFVRMPCAVCLRRRNDNVLQMVAARMVLRILWQPAQRHLKITLQLNRDPVQPRRGRPTALRLQVHLGTFCAESHVQSQRQFASASQRVKIGPGWSLSRHHLSCPGTVRRLPVLLKMFIPFPRIETNLIHGRDGNTSAYFVKMESNKSPQWWITPNKMRFFDPRGDGTRPFMVRALSDPD